MSKTDLENKISGDSFAITENVLSKDKDFHSLLKWKNQVLLLDFAQWEVTFK